MAYSRSSEGYPLPLRECVEAVGGSNLPHSLDCTSAREASALRARFHAFRVACRRDAAHPPPHWSAERTAEHRAFLAIFEGLEFRVEGNALIIAPRDTQGADLLARLKPIGDTTQVPATEGAAASLETLLEKLK
mgnify:CR=1 FL=1